MSQDGQERIEQEEMEVDDEEEKSEEEDDFDEFIPHDLEEGESEEDGEADEEENEDGEADDEHESEEEGPPAKKKKKNSKSGANSSRKARRLCRTVIGHEVYSEARASITFDSMKRLSVSGVRPHYSDGTSPTMAEEFPGMTGKEVKKTLQKNIYLGSQLCECKCTPCYNPVTETSSSQFNYKRDLLLHIMLEHVEDNANAMYPCPWLNCGSEKLSLAPMIEHLCQTSHVDCRRWICKIEGCPASYHIPKQLKDHMKSHGEEKNGKDPKYSPQQLEITFNNLINPLIIKEKTLLSEIQTTHKRYIQYRNRGKANKYFRTCALDGCIGVPVRGELCPACQLIIADTPPPYKTTKPLQLVNPTADPPNYFATEIQNFAGQWITICGNEQCHMRFTLNQNQAVCSILCEKFYESNTAEAYSSPTTFPPPRLVVNFWQWNPVHDQVDANGGFTDIFDDSPTVGDNIPTPYRHHNYFFRPTGWDSRCSIEGCDRITPDCAFLCKSCKNTKKEKPATNLHCKRKPLGHNFNVTVDQDNTNGTLSFRENDTIWIKQEYDGKGWRRKCANWDCGNTCTQRDSLLCAIHRAATQYDLPEFLTPFVVKRRAAISSQSEQQIPAVAGQSSPPPQAVASCSSTSTATKPKKKTTKTSSTTATTKNSKPKKKTTKKPSTTTTTTRNSKTKKKATKTSSRTTTTKTKKKRASKKNSSSSPDSDTSSDASYSSASSATSSVY